MTLTEYTFVQSVHAVLLHEEIEATDITIALDRVDFEAGTTSVWFKEVLSAAEITTLNAVLAAHDENAYVSEIDTVTTVFTKQEDDSKIPYVYASPRPMNHYSYFSSCGDSPTEIGEGNKLIFDMTAQDVTKTVDVTFNENVYLKDGLIQCKDAPFGALVDIHVVHPAYPTVPYIHFGKKVPIYGTYPITLNTDDRAFIPVGMIVRITVSNSTGNNGDDAAAAFKVFGRLELFREKPPLG